MNRWITTYTGKQFSYTNLSPDNVDIEDIAHALSHISRFCGHLNHHYSVAQHCVILSEMVKKGYELEALLHDATEAYLSDIPSPAKILLPDFNALEDKIWKEAISVKFNLANYISQEVHDKDKILLLFEMFSFFDQDKRPDWVMETAESMDLDIPEDIIPLSAQDAKQLFLEKFSTLETGRNTNG
jgi:5'-deoxynucleotidase YfbR-like HD superfamily hydrolase